MQVKDLGEFALIARINSMAIQDRRPMGRSAPVGDFPSLSLLVDTGDDTAAWSISSSSSTVEAAELFTTDTVVEGIHFTRDTTPWRDLGWKSLAANISDIAAMGGQPKYALVTLGLPPETLVADIEELYRGMLEIGNQYGMAIVGGDMVRSPTLFITVALTGLGYGPLLRRDTARPGHQVAVSGWLGNSGGGLKLLQDGQTTTTAAADFLRQAHRRPQPSVAAGQLLAQAGVLTAMDVSDGLADDLSKLCLASGVAARLDAAQAPIHPLLRQTFPDQCLDLALHGGEDYLLLFTGPAETLHRIMPTLPEGAARIGEITAGPPGQVTLVFPDGVEATLARSGWDHFG